MNKLIIITLLLLVASIVQAYTVNLRWTANKETDLAGYRIYNNVTKTQYTDITPITLKNMTTVTTTINNLTGVNQIYVTAYNNSGQESGSSNVVTVDYTTPQKVQNLRIIP